jgi:hypothetical protein
VTILVGHGQLACEQHVSFSPTRLINKHTVHYVTEWSPSNMIIKVGVS